MISQALAYAPMMTVEEFLEWPGDGVNRLHALIDGEPVAMNPPSLRHGLVGGRLMRLLGNHLASTRPECEAAIEPGVRPHANAATNVRVPDLAVSCAPPTDHLMREPVLIVEVLSPSNARETREAVRAYLTIPSVLEVLVLGSIAPSAEILRRHADGNWLPDPVRVVAGEELVLTSFDFRCRLNDLYPA